MCTINVSLKLYVAQVRAKVCREHAISLIPPEVNRKSYFNDKPENLKQLKLTTDGLSPQLYKTKGIENRYEDKQLLLKRTGRKTTPHQD